jgi:hypothetical protein
MRPRILFAASLLLGLALGAYACDNGTFDDPLNVYQPPEAGSPGYTLPEDAGEDAPALLDAGGNADAQAPKDGGEGGAAGDAGEGGSTTDGPADASDLDADDAGG